MKQGQSRRFEELREEFAPPGRCGLCPQGPALEIKVIFTTREDTVTALKAAEELSRGLDARIFLLAPQVVPLQFPLTRPPVSIGFTELRFQTIAGACQGDTQITVQVFLCREKSRCLLKILKPDSLVLIGGKKRWWPTPGERLARTLQAHGHRVILVDGG